MTQDRLSKLFEQYKMSPHDASLKSKTWYQQQIALLSGTKINKTTLMSGRPELKRTTKIVPGSMYLFEYDPKHAETLPYYDRFPLVIPFRQTHNAFYGLNLHYLQPQLRVILLDKLMIYATNKNLDETTKLRFTWQLASAAAKNKFIGSCVKMYLVNQVQSQFLKVLPEHWVGALMLPTEQFVGASKGQVWTESRRI